MEVRHRGQREGGGRLDLELRDRGEHALGLHRSGREPSSAGASSDFSTAVQSVCPVGQDDHHRHVAALVGELEERQPVLPGEAELAGAVHGRDLLLLAARGGEVGRPRPVLLERYRPVAEEVDGVDQDEPRSRRSRLSAG